LIVSASLFAGPAWARTVPDRPVAAALAQADALCGNPLWRVGGEQLTHACTNDYDDGCNNAFTHTSCGPNLPIFNGYPCDPNAPGVYGGIARSGLASTPACTTSANATAHAAEPLVDDLVQAYLDALP
jgi:hypothetical protein